MMNKWKSSITVLMTLATLTSCSTIVNGTRQSIGISSNPTDANVWVDRAFMGSTPIVVEMTRQDEHVVTIALDGFETYEAVLTRKFNGWVLGNIFIGGVIGIAVDAISGAMYSLTPDQVQANLCQNNIVHCNKSTDSYIAIVLQPDPSWTKVGNLVPLN